MNTAPVSVRGFVLYRSRVHHHTSISVNGSRYLPFTFHGFLAFVVAKVDIANDAHVLFANSSLLGFLPLAPSRPPITTRSRQPRPRSHIYDVDSTRLSTLPSYRASLYTGFSTVVMLYSRGTRNLFSSSRKRARLVVLDGVFAVRILLPYMALRQGM